MDYVEPPRRCCPSTDARQRLHPEHPVDLPALVNAVSEHHGRLHKVDIDATIAKLQRCS